MEESRGALLFQKVCHILNIILKVAVMVIIAFPFYWRPVPSGAATSRPIFPSRLRTP